MSTQNFEELSERVVAAAKTGNKEGFVIKMGRRTGRKIADPLGDNQEEVVYDQKKTFRKQSMSAQDYKRYQDARKELAAIPLEEEAKRVDLTLRLYEYLAMKFLGMTHDEFVIADFDDVVIATLACDALFGSGNSSTPSAQPSVTRQTIHTTTDYPVRDNMIDPMKSRRTFYKAPDEE